MTLLLLDTDILLYKAIQSTEQEIDWGDDVWTLFTDLKEAKKVFQLQVDTIKDKLGSDDILCCLSDHTDNFRKRVADTYKSNRKSIRKPVGYGALRKWVEETLPCLMKPSLEADDVMGIMATKPNAGPCVVVSDDKDLRTIPCKLYSPMKDELSEIRPAQADAFFLEQTLKGDPVDGYSGCKGVGEKTAAKILGSRPAWSSVEQAFIKAGMTKEDALTQARLARILRWEDYDHDKGEPILWTPS